MREEILLALLHPNLNQASLDSFYILPIPLLYGHVGPQKVALKKKRLAVSICIRLLVTTKVWPCGREGKTRGPSESAILS